MLFLRLELWQSGWTLGGRLEGQLCATPAHYQRPAPSRPNHLSIVAGQFLTYIIIRVFLALLAAACFWRMRVAKHSSARRSKRVLARSGAEGEREGAARLALPDDLLVVAFFSHLFRRRTMV